MSGFCRFVSLRKKTDSMLILLINKCKLSYLTSYRCLNLSCMLGASMVKYTTPLPCIGLGESDSKLFTHFQFWKGKVINT